MAWLRGLAILIALAGSGEVRAGVPARSSGTTSGRAVVVMPPGEGDGQRRVLATISVLDRDLGPHDVSIRARAVAGDGDDAVTPVVAARPLARPMDHLIPDVSAARVVGVPAPSREFHLMVREDDPAQASSYVPIRADRVGIGRRVAIYADRRDLDRIRSEVVELIVRTFDEVIEPHAAACWGHADDIDGDGRFAVVLTSWLGRLGGGPLAVDGLVRAADLDPRVEPPFGNRADVLFLDAGLEPGPHLQTVLAHEYAHAVAASVRARCPAPRGRDEEGWLDEGLAYLVEDEFGFSRSNLDPRVLRFLATPEAHPLLVGDYYQAGLFRSDGPRGASYDFLSWCAGEVGRDAMIGRLIRSPDRGLDNLQKAVGAPFADLLRGWACDRVLGASRPDEPIQPWPRCVEIDAGSTPDHASIAGTGTRFVIARIGPEATRIEATARPGTSLLLTCAEMPADLPDFTASAHAGPDATIALSLAFRGDRGARVEGVRWVSLDAPPSSSGTEWGAIGPGDLAFDRGVHALSLRLTDPPPGPRRIALAVIVRDREGGRATAWTEVDFTPADGGRAGAGIATRKSR
jgi:hypothetical protein